MGAHWGAQHGFQGQSPSLSPWASAGLLDALASLGMITRKLVEDKCNAVCYRGSPVQPLGREMQWEKCHSVLVRKCLRFQNTAVLPFHNFLPFFASLRFSILPTPKGLCALQNLSWPSQHRSPLRVPPCSLRLPIGHITPTRDMSRACGYLRLPPQGFQYLVQQEGLCA